MKKYIICLLTIGLFVGCATTNFTGRSDLDNYGIIVGRFPTLTHYFAFEPLVPDTTPSFVTMANPTDVKVDASEKTVGFKLKEGTYYIQGIVGSKRGFFGDQLYRIAVPLELRRPIVVRKGTVTYIGSFTYNMGGAFAKSSVQFSTSMAGVVDELSRDHPDLRDVSITSLFE